MFRDAADLRRAMLEAEQAARHAAGALRDGDPQAAAQILRIRERVEALAREIEVRNRLTDAALELRASRLRMARADPAGAREAMAAAMSALDRALEALRAGAGSGRSGSSQASSQVSQEQGEPRRPPVVDLSSRRAAARSSVEEVRRELVAGAAESLARGDVRGAMRKLEEADARLRALGGGSRAPEPVQAAVRQAQNRAAQAADAARGGQVSAARRLLYAAADGLRLAVEAALMGLSAARHFERRRQDAASLSR